ncbi:MAG: hypothetical protein OEV99_04240 [Nitrospira sp.]|nr:hypothetical protein [Nitrospira sp.]MDH4369032.1 hypothetical protein [Nitrospira sp.]MDH5348261.1 hypothetical protein [Nitrospira sp.]MDH5496602.1 hypothetical protein [Nitrospira sp.]MDH5725033.1 hypothetical protein [Nitrospira sp.]
MHILRSRIVLLTTLFVAIGFTCFPPEAATDELPRSSRVGPLRIPLASYERIPISTVQAHPDRYQMREIRLAGLVTSIRTELITNRLICGRAHERTKLTLEDDTGEIVIVDQGACGRNQSRLKAPMLQMGQHIDLLVLINTPTSPGALGSTLEATIRFLDLVRD